MQHCMYVCIVVLGSAAAGAGRTNSTKPSQPKSPGFDICCHVDSPTYNTILWYSIEAGGSRKDLVGKFLLKGLHFKHWDGAG